MINKERIVPVVATDLITLYGTIMKIAGETITALEADSAGEFTITTAASGDQLANEPVKKLNFDTGVSAATVYFVPAFDYAGFEIEGAAVVPTGDDVNPDGATLYKAELATGAVTISQVGF